MSRSKTCFNLGDDKLVEENETKTCSPTRKNCLHRLKCSNRAIKDDEHVRFAPLEEKKEDTVDHIPDTVDRMASEDTQDTPPVCNIDHNKPPKEELSLKERSLRLDAICSKYFNTPVGEPMHKSTPLGDDISPVEDEDKLVFPDVDSKRKIFEGNNTSIMLKPDKASMKIGYEEVKGTKYTSFLRPRRSTRRPSQQSISQQSVSQHSVSQHSTQSDVFSWDSSNSSVSSFSFMSSNASLGSSKGKSPTKYAFFWRTHPKVSDVSKLTESKANKGAVFMTKIEEEIPLEISEKPEERARSTLEQKRGPSCSPFLQPEVVNKLWMESKQFRDEVDANWKANCTSEKHVLASFKLIPEIFNRANAREKDQRTHSV